MISFAAFPGSLFSTLGKLGVVVKLAKSYQASQQQNLINLSTGVIAQLTPQPDIQALIGSSWIGLMGGPEGACSVAQQVASQVVQRVVYLDNPQFGQTFSGGNTLTCLQEIIRQMKVANATILAMTVSQTPTQFSTVNTNVGNGLVVASVRRPLDGAVLENSFAENITYTCTQDSYVGGATAGNEGISITGIGNEGDVFAWDWPAGSNGSTFFNAIDGSVDNGSGNLLVNSGFDSWLNLANVPDNWTLTVGTPGTTTAKESTLVFDGAASLQLIGDGTTNFNLNQQFNSATGTTTTLDPLTQYSFAIWLRRDGTAAGTGVLTIDLCSTPTGPTINDQGGNPNSFTIDLTSLTTTWLGFTGSFRTPLILPANQYIRFRLTTGLTAGRSVYLDLAGYGLEQQLYTGGPFVSCHSGSVPFVGGDFASVAISNSRGAGGTLSTFQTLLAQLLPTGASAELIYPSSVVPSISDGLIA